MVAPRVLDKGLEFDIVKPWVWACVGRKARAVLDATVVTDVESLVRGLQDYLASDGDKVAGKTAVFGAEGIGFRRQAYNADSGSEKKKVGALGGSSASTFKCFKCGKMGHKAADCWQGGGASSSAGSKVASGSGGKVVCYVCGIEGHKSTECTKRENQKGAVAKPVRQLWLRDSSDTVIEGVVNEKRATLLLDSGAHITIVPEAMIVEGSKTGGSVLVKPFQSKVPIRLPTAKVRFLVEGLDEWEELVALSPSERGKESEVLYGLDLKSARGLDLVILANKLGQAGVNRVTTRSMGKQEALEEKETAELVASERPKVKTVVAGAVEKAVTCKKKKKKAVVAEAVESVEKSQAVAGKLEAGEGETAEDRPAEKPKPGSVVIEIMSSEKGTGEENLAADRPASDSEPVALAIENEEEWPNLGSSEEKEIEMEEGLPDLAQLAEEEVDLEEEVMFCLRESKEKLEDLEIPPVKKGLGSRPELVREVLADSTLEGWRELAEKGEQGFSWDRGLLFQARTTHSVEVVHLMVLPKKECWKWLMKVLGTWEPER